MEILFPPLVPVLTPVSYEVAVDRPGYALYYRENDEVYLLINEVSSEVKET